MTNGEMVETPMFCLVCGGPVSAECIYEDNNFNVYCSADDSHTSSRDILKVYDRLLSRWWDDQHTKYDEERMGDRAIGTRWAR